ncbi:MAG: hypothetical protein ACYSUX_10245 [Planctomycetota bacterium]
MNKSFSSKKARPHRRWLFMSRTASSWIITNRLCTITINGVNLKPFYEVYSRHSVYLDITLD